MVTTTKSYTSEALSQLYQGNQKVELHNTDPSRSLSWYQASREARCSSQFTCAILIGKLISDRGLSLAIHSPNVLTKQSHLPGMRILYLVPQNLIQLLDIFDVDDSFGTWPLMIHPSCSVACYHLIVHPLQACEHDKVDCLDQVMEVRPSQETTSSENLKHCDSSQ